MQNFYLTRSRDGAKLLLRGRYPQISQITADLLLLRALAAYMPHATARRREAIAAWKVSADFADYRRFALAACGYHAERLVPNT